MARSTITTSTINRRSTRKGVATINPIPGNKITFTPFHHKARRPMVKTDVRIAAIMSKVNRRFMDLTQEGLPTAWQEPLRASFAVSKGVTNRINYLAVGLEHLRLSGPSNQPWSRPKKPLQRDFCKSVYQSL
jgi:hypothetical protein